MTVKRRDMEAWLQRRGFALLPGGSSSHRHFAGHGVKITMPGHGSQDMRPGTLAGIRRLLKFAGIEMQDFPGETR